MGSLRSFCVTCLDWSIFSSIDICDKTRFISFLNFFFAAKTSLVVVVLAVAIAADAVVVVTDGVLFEKINFVLTFEQPFFATRKKDKEKHNILQSCDCFYSNAVFVFSNYRLSCAKPV